MPSSQRWAVVRSFSYLFTEYGGGTNIVVVGVDVVVVDVVVVGVVVVGGSNSTFPEKGKCSDDGRRSFSEKRQRRRRGDEAEIVVGVGDVYRLPFPVPGIGEKKRNGSFFLFWH